LSSTWNYRIAVYLLDSHKRRVLLMKAEDGIYKGKFIPFTFPLPQNKFPQELLQEYFKEKFNVSIEFIFHDSSLPAVLDSNTIQTIAPYFTQISKTATGPAVIDFVYLAFSTSAFKVENPTLSWCLAEDLVGRIAPKHVKRTVKHILKINQT